MSNYELAAEYGRHRGSHVALLKWLVDNPEVYDSKTRILMLAEVELGLSNTHREVAERLYGRYRTLLKREHDALIDEALEANG